MAYRSRTFFSRPTRQPTSFTLACLGCRGRPHSLPAFALPMATLDLYSLESHPHARCNDGTPAVYYFRPATAAVGQSQWTFMLGSGGMCYDQQSCSRRCGAGSFDVRVGRCGLLNGTRTRPRNGTWAGIFSSSDPELRHANLLFVPYCSSDAWWANASRWGMEFRGSAILQAALDEAVTRGLGRAGRNDTLLFGGFSAGSRGAMVHLDSVPAMLGDAAARVDVLGVLDSPLWLDQVPLDGGRELA